jgi:uncharacterized cupredoxin-like copper-binding protein
MRRESIERIRSLARPSALLLTSILFLGVTAVAGSAEAQGDKAAGAVEVHLSEYTIDMPHTLPPGPTTFHLHNDGHKTHRFKITGPGIESEQSTAVKPGDSETVQVTLQPGEYKVSCPIGSHSAKGMMLTLVVGAKSGE